MTPLFSRPILAIETSCDETSVAIVQGRRVLANAVSSQIDLHRKWGGVVPEAAARAHVEAIVPMLEEARRTAGLELSQVGAIAVTNRPGLVGALSVGVSAAKALALSLDVPLIGIHHLEGHLCSVLASHDEVPAEVPFPHLALIVSGGHTELVLVRALGDYEILGETRDDAAGEAFDKTARLLGLGSPGGPAIQAAAMTGNPRRYPLPSGLQGDVIDFSFSGLKTAVLRLTQLEGDRINAADLAASLQETVVSVLAERTLRAADRYPEVRGLSLVGGVAANLALRSRLGEGASRRGWSLMCPPIALCTDNAAMIAMAASARLARGERDGWDLETRSSAELSIRMA